MEYIYAALLLHKLGHAVNEDNLKKVIHATGSQVDESKIKTLIAALNGVDIAKELEHKRRKKRRKKKNLVNLLQVLQVCSDKSINLS